MRAARFHAAGDIRIEDIPPPQPSDDKVLVDVEWCGICGSDLNEFIFGPFAIPSARKGPHPLTNALLPVTMGHEFTGRISHVPEAFASSTERTRQPLRKGQAVVIDPRFYCSSCTPCTQSATNSCEKLGFMGISGGGGGLSDVVAVSPEQIHVLPERTSENGGVDSGDGPDLAAAALVEPLAVAWHAVRLFFSISAAQFGSGSEKVNLRDVPVLVVGAGPLGVAMVFVLRARGAQTIFVSEVSKARREMLREAGIVTETLDPAQDNVAKRCKEVTGSGVGVVFDCAGSQAGFQAGCESLRVRGVFVNLAAPKMPITLPFGPFMWKEIMYKCSLAYDQGDFKDTLDAFVSGHFRGVEKMITRRIALEDIVEQGFKKLVKPNDHIKILATPKQANIR
ncbi:chaperonin 10-like protein [Aspergillus aurantiobrunneus]